MWRAARPTAQAGFPVSAVVGKDSRSRSTDHGRQTVAGAAAPPDWKATNQKLTSTANTSPAAWRSAPSRVASSGLGPKFPQRFLLAATVSGHERTTRSATAPCIPQRSWPRPALYGWSETPVPALALHRRTRFVGSTHRYQPVPAYRKRSLGRATPPAAAEPPVPPPPRNRRFLSGGSRNKPLAASNAQTTRSPCNRGQIPEWCRA